MCTLTFSFLFSGGDISNVVTLSGKAKDNLVNVDTRNFAATREGDGGAATDVVVPAGANAKGFLALACSKRKPLYLQSSWDDADTTQHLSVIVLLPSGIGEDDLLDYKVEDEGRTLVVVVAWPSLMTDMERVHAYWEDDKGSGSGVGGGKKEVAVREEMMK